MSGVGAGLTALLLTCGALEALAALYLVVIAVAAQHRRPAPPGSPSRRVVVLVPARDEEALVARCVESLMAQDYPYHLLRVVVVADNCGDATAARAAAAGAEVLARDRPDSRGKGQALRWALDVMHERGDAFDAVAVVDADSVADPGLLRGLASAMDRGAEAVQGEYLVLPEGGVRSELRAAAFLLFHVARPAGRAALGMGCALVGNGMLFSRELLQRVPWNAFTSTEDLEYTMVLRLAGVVPRFAPGAVVRGPAATSGRAGRTQRLRWEGGRFNVMRTFLPPLLHGALAGRSGHLLDAAVDLAVPPLGLLVLLAAATAGFAALLALAGLTPAAAALPAAGALIGVAVFVLAGLRAARAPWSTYRALLSAPAFLVAKLGTYAHLARGLDADRWVRTERSAADSDSAAPRVDVCGVPVDAVDQQQALAVIEAAMAAPQHLQVCTVNVHFLARAARDRASREVLAGSGLNVADGAPVLRLARLAGGRLPERVAGVDLVAQLLARAADGGMRVFLLGGTGGVTARLAAVLAAHHPTLQIAGALEPDMATIESGAAREAVAAAAPNLVLVAMGHPKQELWIRRNLPLLPPCVAIGVGCTFDVLAGDRRRAPAWMRRHGLEWAWRVAAEPRRLLLRYLGDALLLLTVLMPRAILAGLTVRSRHKPGALAPDPR